METERPHLPPAGLAERPLLVAGLEIGLIFAIFFIHGAWPVPEVNETHYLAKARHYWNPQWCAEDFFLRTADAHQVFYWTCGWLTRWLSLPATAWVGRLATWSLLAWAWRRLSLAIVPLPLAAVLSAALFVAGTSRLHMAGEWIIGGFEAKGLAYVFVLLGLEAVVRNRWQLVWPLLGAASAFHVVVGAWSVLAAGLAWLATGENRPPLGAMIRPLAIGLVLALPGLLPALELSRGVEPWVLREANRIYVFERLSHHLVPQLFPIEFIRRHLLLWLLWGVLCRLAPSTPGERRLNWVVGGAIGIAVLGFGVAALTASNRAIAAAVLRYYWFRMADIFVPLGVALLATALIVDLRQRRMACGNLLLVVAMLAAGCHLGEIVLRRSTRPRPPADDKIADLEAWHDICDWVRDYTPPDSVFLIPRTAQTFRWYTGRAEVVCRKDIPQDADGIVQWWRRMNDVYRDPRLTVNPSWYRSLVDLGPARLRQLGEKYDADFVLTDAQPPLPLELVSPPNRAYAVYRLKARR